jgi:N-methylhydantoinase A
LRQKAEQWFASEGAFLSDRALDWAADVRYFGQSHELTIPMREGPFHADAIEQLIAEFVSEHTRLYGYAAGAAVELVTLRLTVRATVDRSNIKHELAANTETREKVKGRRKVHFPGHGFIECPIYDRAALRPGERIDGPAIVEQMDTTAVIFPDQEIKCDEHGNMLINFL